MRNLVFVIAACGAGLAEPAPEPAPPTAPASPAATSPQSRAEFLHNVIADYFVPRMARFAQTAPALEKSLESLCASPGSDTLKAARAAWVDNMLVWESASAIGFGPLLARRSVFRIDYWPARPNLVTRALSAPPTTIKGLELIGGPAKGIPTLEWLLWTPAEKPEILSDPGRCAYARLLAQDVVDEARGLDEAFVALAKNGLPEGTADDAFAGLLNLANGGLEQLGVKKIEAPARFGDGNKNFPRLLSGQIVPAWNAQWTSLRIFLVGDGDAHHDNLDSFLRTQGLTAVADKLRTAADRVTKELNEMHEATPATALKLGKDMGMVRNAVADDVAPALHIAVQFGDDDGD
jgi:predicted lipoprotein